MKSGTRLGEPLPEAVQAGCELCASCNACRAVCTVQLATNRLPPLQLLRMAALGLADSLLASSELWFCIQCNRCSSSCPMTVKPSELIRRLRDEAVREDRVSESTLQRLECLGARFQRVRWHMVARGAEGPELAEMAQCWRSWSEVPIEAPHDAIRMTGSAGAAGSSCREDQSELESRLGFASDFAACMTCGACSAACPIAHDRCVFDPVRLFRSLNLGQQDELLRSPSLWLCLGCQACTDVCSQQVAGHLVIRALQQLALARGLAPSAMHARLRAIDHALLPRYLEQVEALFETGATD